MKKIITITALLLSACGGSGEQSTTTTEAIKPVTIAAVGDISCSQSQRKSGKYLCEDDRVADIVRQQNPDHLFLLGDIQYHSHTVKNFRENFALIWADLLDISKPIPGNHEYVERGAKGYYAIWTKYPNPGYYSFELNEDWMVVALNTNDNCSDLPCKKGSEQYRWLEAQLTQNPDKCVIAMAHHPRFSSGAHGSSISVKDAYDLMAKHGVVMLLSGHDHHYERVNTSPKQFVVGTGGKDVRRVGKIENSVFSYNKGSGALFLEIYGKTVSTEFITVEGNVLDTDVTTCSK